LAQTTSKQMKRSESDRKEGFCDEDQDLPKRSQRNLPLAALA